MQWRVFSVFFPVFVISGLSAIATSEPLAQEGVFSPEAVDFSDFLVEVSSQHLRQVDFNSHPNAISFKSRLNVLKGQPANFSGHYFLTFWGCGTGCQQFSVVDVETGQVFMDENWSTSMGVCFRADSALLITNPGAGESARVDSSYYLWDGGQLNLLGRGSIKQPDGCDSAHE